MFSGAENLFENAVSEWENRFSILALSCGRQKLEGGQNDDVTTPSLSGVQGTAWLTVLNSLSWAFLSWLLWLHPHLVGNVLVGKTFQSSCTAPCRASGKASQGTGNAPATILFISVWGQKIYLKTGQRSDVKCSKHISSSYRYQHVAWLEKDDVQKCLHETCLFFFSLRQSHWPSVDQRLSSHWTRWAFDVLQVCNQSQWVKANWRITWRQGQGSSLITSQAVKRNSFNIVAWKIITFYNY